MKVVGDATESKTEKASVKKDKGSTKKAVFDTLDSATEIPGGSAAKEVEYAARLPGVTAGSMADKMQINFEKYDETDLLISADEKAAFVDSLITGGRYRQTYTIFGGKVNMVIRSRTTKETQAMYAYIRSMLSKDGGNLSLLEGDMQYLLLVAQIEELNGTKYPEMREPYTFTETDGKTLSPGWIVDLAAWKDKPEGLTSALINRIQLFEYKYWTMVKEASSKNFWNSDTSIAE